MECGAAVSTQAPLEPDTPEAFKPVLWLWHHTRRHRAALLRPPVLAACVIVAAIAYWIGVSHSNDLLAVRSERIALLSDQVTAYKDRLQGATPDEAAKLIALLQSRLAESEAKLQIIAPDNPRRLQAKERQRLADHRGKLIRWEEPLFVYTGSLGDSADYAVDFIELFSEIGVRTIGPVMTACRPDNWGVLVGLKNPNTPSDRAKAFIEALDDAGLHPNIARWSAPADRGGLDFDLFICPSRPKK